MIKVDTRAGQGELSAVVAAARAGDKTAFAELAQRYRPELQAHCYRMVGSFHESEDLVQETLLRAWRKRETFQDRSTFRAWLYGIATNACLDALERRPAARRVVQAAEPGGSFLPPGAIPWLQPYPDRLLDAVAPSEAEPDAVVVAKETIELAFLAAIQHLSPRQRAVLILRDVLGWSAKDTAVLLDASVAAVNSALQRARPAIKDHLAPQRIDWSPSARPTDEERATLQRYMAAIERGDDDAIADVLRADARLSQQPGAGGYEGEEPAVIVGREAIVESWAPALHGPYPIEFRLVGTWANRQPTAATYIRFPGVADFQPFALAVLTVEQGLVAQISVFDAGLFPAFGLPAKL